MSLIEADVGLGVGPDSAGVRMTPEEFDAIEDYDELYHYELIHGVLVVTPFASEAETKRNEILGHLLLTYQETHPQGRALDETFYESYVRTADSRRRANRLIWSGLGRAPIARAMCLPSWSNSRPPVA